MADRRTYSALHVAAGAGQRDVVAALLDGGAEVEARGRRGETALMSAAASDRVDVIALLLARGADVAACDDAGRQAIHFAASHGHLRSVVALHEAGAELGARDGDGHTAAYRAALRSAGVELVVWLMDRGLDVREPLPHGSSYLHAACVAGSPVVVRRLLEAGAAVDQANDYGVTPLLSLCSSNLPMVAPDDTLASLRLLLAHGADIRHRDRQGRTALHVAVSGHPALTIELLARGAEVDADDDEGRTPLFTAVSLRHRPVIAPLLAAGADPRVVDARGDTLLHRAAGSWDPEWVAYIADLGVDIHARNAAGCTAIDYSHAGASPACDLEDVVNMSKVEQLLRSRGGRSGKER